MPPSEPRLANRIHNEEVWCVVTKRLGRGAKPLVFKERPHASGTFRTVVNLDYDLPYVRPLVGGYARKHVVFGTLGVDLEQIDTGQPFLLENVGQWPD